MSRFFSRGDKNNLSALAGILDQSEFRDKKTHRTSGWQVMAPGRFSGNDRKGFRLWMASSLGVAEFLLKAFPKLGLAFEYLREHPDISHDLVPGWKQVERALLYRRVISMYFLCNPAMSTSEIAAELNDEWAKEHFPISDGATPEDAWTRRPLGKGGLKLELVRRLTNFNIEKIIQEIDYIDRGLRRDGKPHSHGRRGRPTTVQVQENGLAA